MYAEQVAKTDMTIAEDIPYSISSSRKAGKRRLHLGFYIITQPRHSKRVELVDI